MRIAITGGIAEGKSTVLGWIQDSGWSVHSSDSAARSAFADSSIQLQLAALTGLVPPLLPSDLREAILGSHDVRRAVNRLMHPFIGGQAAESDAVFHEVPLLFEACLQSRYDEVWVVSCGEEEQRRRLIDRYGDPRLVEALIAIQLPTPVKLLFGDRVFRTNSPLDTVRTSLREALRVTSIKANCDP